MAERTEQQKNPHDIFFTKLFKIKKNLVDFLDYTLPAKLKNHLDFSDIAYDDTTYVSAKYKKQFSDLVVKTRLDNQQTDINIIDFIFEYLLYIRNLNQNALKKLLEDTIPEGGNFMPIATEEWKAEGKIEGKIEKQIEIAIKMLKKGLAVTLISECTGLPVDQIEDLK